MSVPCCGDAGGVTKDGRPCPVAANLGPTGFCPWHDPDKTRRSAIQAAAAGGATPGLSVEHLGSLETIDDAVRWTKLIGTALARRDITPSEANALMRVLAQWHKNEDLRLRREDLRELERQIAEMQRAKGKAG